MALVLLAAVGWTLWIQGVFFFRWSPLQACRATYGLNPFLECPVIADYLQKNTNPEDTIAVLGSEPEIFFDARRNSATGYIYTYGMMEPQPLARRMQEEMSREIESSRPRYLLVVNVESSWLPQNNERLIFQWLQPYLSSNYRCVGVADIFGRPYGVSLGRQRGRLPAAIAGQCDCVSQEVSKRLREIENVSQRVQRAEARDGRVPYFMVFQRKREDVETTRAKTRRAASSGTFQAG